MINKHYIQIVLILFQLTRQPICKNVGDLGDLAIYSPKLFLCSCSLLAESIHPLLAKKDLTYKQTTKPMLGHLQFSTTCKSFILLPTSACMKESWYDKLQICHCIYQVPTRASHAHVSQYSLLLVCFLQKKNPKSFQHLWGSPTPQTDKLTENETQRLNQIFTTQMRQ